MHWYILEKLNKCIILYINYISGAFLVPYLLMLIFLGLPLFYMELALGQYQKCGAISVWNRICPVFSGVGYGICLVSTLVGMYYNTIIAWGVFYMFASFRSEVPWAGCNNSWNTENCMSLSTNFNKSLITNFTLTASDEYYTNEVLGVQGHNGIEDIGAPRWQLVLSLAAVFFIVYFSIWKGIKSSGKAVWITATVPYVVLIILLIRGCTLPGSVEGIKYYITPVWGKLLDEQVWIDAASQIFFSLGPGFGTLLALASYNNFHNNCYFDAITVSIINCMTSFLAGFVVFAVLGYMAQAQGVSIENLPTNGPGLVFVVYPEVIATLDGSVFWSIIFFLMLITLGLDSTFGGLEAVITAICDEYPLMKRNRELFVLGLVLVCFLGGLPTVTNGGQYVINLLDNHAAPISLLFICFIEAIAVNWFYGCQKFSNDIESMLGHQPGIFWKICWVGICPICLLILFVLSCWKYEGLELMGYVYPPWAVAVGWCITASSILCIPVYGVYRFIITPGTLKQKVLRLIRPSVVSDHLVLNGGSYNKDSYSISMNQTNLSNSVTMESAISLKMNGDSHNKHYVDYDNFLSRDDPTMFTFIQVILMFCICFKISQGLQGGRICLSCNGVVKPRDCSTVVVCGTHELCGLEQVVSSAGIITYNVGCRSSHVCSSPSKKSVPKVRSNIVTCERCCNETALCNSEGCGATGFDPATGKYCYSCPQHIHPDKCDHIYFCYEDQLICNRHNTHLPIIETDEEKAIIDRIAANTEIWLDATDRDQEGVFVWSTTKETVSKYYWASNEPDDPKYTADEDCVEMGPNYLMGWNDAPCDRHVGVLCEYGLSDRMEICIQSRILYREEFWELVPIESSSMMVFYGDHFGQGYSAKLVFRHLCFSKLNYCKTLGAHLPILDSQAKMDKLRQFETNMEFWTDGTEEGHHGQWQWSSIIQAIHNNIWLQGEPNDYNGILEECMETGSKYNWEWNDAPCSWQNRSTHVVCEKPSPTFNQVIG
uniref:Sodium-dependent serotonin transporter n=1 Tax=Magallana gigas TaxID=29159 RepID=K1R5Q9_MAGGI